MRFPILLLFLVRSTLAQSEPDADTVAVYNASTKYVYYGCWNETTSLEASNGARALADGINESNKGNMTVPLCLDFCASGDNEYKYAGLEWSRYALPIARPP